MLFRSLAMGGVIMGIIVSLVGFFGYSTMQSIEEKARKIATDAANDAFNKQLENLQNMAFKKYLEDKAKPEVDKKIEEALNKYEGDKSASIDDLTKRMKIVEFAITGLGSHKKTEKENETPNVVPDPNPFDK